MKKVLFTTLILCLGSVSSATIINIPADYPTIQQGIDASSDGDTVLVQPGTYVENINFNGHNIVLGSLFLTTGDTSHIAQTLIDGDSAGTVVTFESGENRSAVILGFTLTMGYGDSTSIDTIGGGITCISSSCPTIVNNLISANYSIYGGGISIVSSSPYIGNNNITENSAVNGGGISFIMSDTTVIINNIIEENNAYLGGGIYGYMCSDFYPHSQIKNNIIRNNKADLNGGGIDDYYSVEVIEENTIVGNSAVNGFGGGICGIIGYFNSTSINDNLILGNYAESGGGISGISSGRITNNTIQGNTASGFGGGLDLFGEVTVSYNIFEGNHARNGGGIFSVYPDASTISHNIIDDNSADSCGGGIFLGRNDHIFINNTITNNYALYSGGGLYCRENILGEPEFINTVFWSNSAMYYNEIYLDSQASISVIYCDIQDTLWPGVGNINSDPMFRNTANGDFHLMSIFCGDPYDSPCIDAGDPAILDSLLDCSWGLGGPRSDMGAYGGGDSLITAIFDEYIPTPDRIMLMQNYPNPFNASTTIRFIMPQSQHVKLTIYDLLGRQVQTLPYEYKQAGVHTVTFDASHLASGVYFYRLQAGDNVETRRMVLLK
ncbi:MAG: T9SS type A sorting domain-containing protein [Candidatus Zixiibacteriota bacterium]|nr:MAG: T9SS type A sorting domain-containing protein [candidate division Zixibacteria bacterium]